jgi:hypothetical protein
MNEPFVLVRDKTIPFPVPRVIQQYDSPIGPYKPSKIEMLKESFFAFKEEITPLVEKAQKYAASRNDAINHNLLFDNGGMEEFNTGFGMDLNAIQNRGREMIATGMTRDGRRARGRRKKNKPSCKCTPPKSHKKVRG